MFRLFQRRKHKTTSIELPKYSYIDADSDACEIPAQFQPCSNGKMERLMELIGRAIEEWATEYHLQNLPRKVIFEQALDAMQIMQLAMDNKQL